MKHLLLSICALLICLYSQAQELLKITDSTYIVGIINKTTEVKEQGAYYTYKTLHKNSRVLVASIVDGSNGDLLVIYLNKKYIVPSELVSTTYDNLYQQLSSESWQNRSKLDSVALTMAETAHLYEQKKAFEFVGKLRSAGLAIVDYSVYDESEYTDVTGFRVEVLNLSKKIIKYITFHFTGINAVDDPVSSKSRKGIGPIKPEATGSYEFEYVWFSDIIEYVKIKSIIVQYMDGSSKTFSAIDKLLIPDHYKDVLLTGNGE